MNSNNKKKIYKFVKNFPLRIKKIKIEITFLRFLFNK